NYDLSEADADALVRASWATGLRSLRLLSTSQGAQRVLLKAKSLSGLTKLWISGMRSGQADGVVGRWIREATHLQNLTYLDVSDSQMKDRGIIDLAQSPHLARLTHLDVSNNDVTGAGLLALARSPHLGNLRKLVIGHGAWRLDEGFRALKER